MSYDVNQDIQGLNVISNIKYAVCIGILSKRKIVMRKWVIVGLMQKTWNLDPKFRLRIKNSDA